MKKDIFIRSYIGESDSDIIIDHPLKFLNDDFVVRRLSDDTVLTDIDNSECDLIHYLCDNKNKWLSFTVSHKNSPTNFRHYEYDSSVGIGIMVYKVSKYYDPKIILIESGNDTTKPNIINCLMTYSLTDIQSLSLALDKTYTWIKNQGNLGRFIEVIKDSTKSPADKIWITSFRYLLSHLNPNEVEELRSYIHN